MPSITSSEPAATLRRAVAALRRRSPIEPGDLVAAVTPERTAALAEKLEHIHEANPAHGAAPGGATPPAAALDADDIVTLDSWIRLAESAMLHGDLAELRARTELAAQLRALRTLVAPGDARLSGDPRDA
jgi:hypothetical protein